MKPPLLVHGKCKCHGNPHPETPQPATDLLPKSPKMIQPGGDPNYTLPFVKFVLLLVLLPFSLAHQLYQLILDWLVPKPLTWEWDTAANPGRRRIDTWNTLKFPKGFLWGTATAAHQVEGGCQNNNWYKWEQSMDPETKKSRIQSGHKSGKATDHWNRLKEDTQLMKDLGCNAYRFSVEWSKIEPRKGEWDASAIAHYREEIELLIKNGITPMVTLHHFTQPIWFDDLGGWEKRENVDYFVRFSEKVYEEFSELVPFWCTFNEPTVFVLVGWLQGSFPPGKRPGPIWSQIGDALSVLQNLLIAHVQVYKQLKAIDSSPQIGLVHNIFHMRPYRRWNPIEYFCAWVADELQNNLVIQFLRTGEFKFSLPIVGPRFNMRIKEAPNTFDFVGLNFYSQMHMRFWLDSKDPLRSQASPEEIAHGVMTDMEYAMYAEGFYLALKRLSRALPKKPIYVTENGVACDDDSRRQLFLKRYLYAMSRAYQEGVDIRGYFYWTLMDNFEWAFGYNPRFGLYEVDFGPKGDGVNASLKRRLRPGSEYFREVAKRFSK